jgi:hypothetical protein
MYTAFFGQLCRLAAATRAGLAEVDVTLAELSRLRRATNKGVSTAAYRRRWQIIQALQLIESTSRSDFTS